MTKMVQLSDEAYARLKAQKRKGESFSDVVVRITAQGASLRDLVSLGRSPEEIRAHERMVQEMDRLDRRDAGRDHGRA